ncbi:MAG: MotA/TolQ/ExbB proton channel family protein [Candidatus Latescibacteria bacterium]|jgi:biopolymer transport protein ExbB|nr:MotA/TolQ/ExbB proton channel family protein [Candidatus Latescibacterota bacterium]
MGWSLFEQGGLMMYPLTICSILALGIAIERGFALRHRRIIRPEIVSVIENIQGSEDIGLALTVCRQYDGPFSGVMRAGLDNRHLPLDEIRESILDQGRQEMGVLQKGLVVLETVAGVSPLLGLLGTVLGMIKVFQQVSEAGVGQANLLAGGISEAILTTAAGLFIAIPSLVFYNFFSTRAESLILEIEKYANSLLKKLRGFQAPAEGID